MGNSVDGGSMSSSIGTISSRCSSIGSNWSCSSSNWGSSNSRCSSIGSNWGSSSNWDMGNSVDGGSMGSYNSLGGVSLICGVMDVRGLNDLLDRVNLVRSRDWDSTGDSNGDINVVFLDIDLWDNVGNLRCDSGVGSDWCSNLGLDNSVSRSWTSRNRCRRNGSIRCRRSRDCWRSNRNGFNDVLWSTSNI